MTVGAGVQILGLVLEMLFQKDGQLSPAYCCQDPTNNRMQNVLFRLYIHLSHSANASIVPALVEVAQDIGRHAYRLLKLLCRSLFAHQLYEGGSKIARGGFAEVELKLTILVFKEDKGCAFCVLEKKPASK